MNTLDTIKSTIYSNDQHHRDGQGKTVFHSNFLLGGKDDMLTSQDVVEKIRDELRQLDEEIRDHHYLRMLQQKKVDLPTLRAFAGHQYHIINSDVRSVALMINRFNAASAQSFFEQVFQGEMQARTNLLPLAQKLGMSVDELENYPIIPGGFAYAAYMGWLAMYGSAAEIVAGFLLNFSAWGYNCGQMSQSLKSYYGFSSRDTVFLDAFATLPSFESIALEIIQQGLDEGVASGQIQRAACLFQGYEKMFWDTMVKLGTV